MKVCSQCSAQNPDSAQFCRNCGAQVSAGESPVIVRSQNYSSSAAGGLPGTANIHNADTAVKAGAGNEAKDFFAWLVSALKRPSGSYATHSWWAFVVMAVMSLLPALQIIIIANKAVGTSLSVFGRHISIPSGAGAGILVSVFFRLWLIFALILYTAVLLAFIGRRLFGEPTTFLQMHDAMVQRFLPAAIAVTVSFLLSLFGVGALSLIIILITLSFIMAVPSVVVSQSENRRAADGFLLWCAFFVITLIALAVLGTVISSIVLGGAQDIINWGF